ncbi:MAG: pro-sigmaK processing inhibitor BofA family protein [Roseburia sp.]|nr:pro-sigmaK processing inhibitor BofA family protein [Roseburia sp.]
MDHVISFVAVGGACGLVLLIALLKQRAQILLNFLVRLVLGVICIFFVNDFLAAQGIDVAVGINPVSLLTSGTLGFSGVALLYAILACNFL